MLEMIVDPRQIVPCSNNDSLYELWVQIPFEMKANSPRAERIGCSPISMPDCPKPNLEDAVLTVQESGAAGRGLRVLPVVDQVHILTTCEFGVGSLTNGMYGKYDFCSPILTHGDGSLVDARNPAKAGEIVTVYAYGLGAPDRSVPSGEPTPAGGVPVTRPFHVSYSGIAGLAAEAPLYVGLVEGNVGLYQINLRVPVLPQDLAPCGENRPSNVTANFEATASRDQFSFCAAP